MLLCTGCGAQNPAGARYCDRCGSMLVGGASAGGALAAPQPAAVGNAGSTTCPQCGMSAIPGEAFCEECGAPLYRLLSEQPAAQRTLVTGADPTALAPAPAPATVLPQPIYPPPVAQRTVVAGAPPTVPAPVSVPAAPAPAHGARALPVRAGLAPARLIMANGAEITLPATMHAIIGRADPISRFTPDIDLTRYGALDAGVGRRHARFSTGENGVQIEDLDSTNGTFVDGVRLTPKQPSLLRDGARLQFGTLVCRLQY